MFTYIATIAVGPGTKDNTYECEFQADDIDHAYEQAKDHVRTAATEWVAGIRKAASADNIDTDGHPWQ